MRATFYLEVNSGDPTILALLGRPRGDRMPEADPRQLAALSAHLDGLEAAVQGFDADPSVGASLRRIARSLQSAAEGMGATEIAAGAQAIQRATDAQLDRSVRNFLERVAELRAAAQPDDVHILIVEDNRTVAAATAAYLDAPGRSVHHAYTAAEALDRLDSAPVDVVVLDLILPDRDGRDLLVHMRESARTATVPVVVLSARGGSVARAECLAVGADDFVEKPASPKELRSAVSRLLRRARERPDGSRDASTGLPNRVGGSEAFDAQRAACERNDRPLALGVLRVQRLGEVAEALGRDAADRLVVEIASVLRGTLPDGGVLARWETGQLVALLPGHDADAAEGWALEAQRAASAIEELEPYAETGESLAIRVGAAGVESGQSLHEALSRAERHLYDRPTAAVSDPDASTATETGEHARPTVLLVEDDRVTSTLIEHRLERDGHTVEGFANGEDAFAWAAERHFDLAILDVKVPGMDGFELLERLRGTPAYAGVPIIMLTGLGSEADVVRGLELGADDYILKPFSPTELLARVRRLLHAHATAATRTSNPTFGLRTG